MDSVDNTFTSVKISETGEIRMSLKKQETDFLWYIEYLLKKVTNLIDLNVKLTNKEYEYYKISLTFYNEKNRYHKKLFDHQNNLEDIIKKYTI